jgi:tRNA dimethylallyltransferase
MAMAFCPYPIIAGPTASGKTAVAVELAKRLDGEVVSADSMQIYDEVSIGTARPSADEMQGIPHHLLGFVPLSAAYSVAQYTEDANRVFADVFSRSKTPILCGGTGLYIQSFSENIQFFSQEPCEELRKQLKARASVVGGAGLLAELRDVDPETAMRLHANDINRIVRALEVYYTTGETISEQARRSKAVPSPYDRCLFLLNYRDRDTLYGRIEQRVDRMLDMGLLAEAKRIFNNDPRATVLQAIGYKELLPYLCGECSLEKAIAQLKISTRHYAKRQLSWFNRMEGVHTVWVDDHTDMASVVDEIERKYQIFCKEGRGDVEKE